MVQVGGSGSGGRRAKGNRWGGGVCEGKMLGGRG